MPRTKKTVFVAMSGGVDSSVAAALLKKQGYTVVGAFMRNWTQAVTGIATNQWQRDETDARAVAEKLAIPFYAFDFEREYRRDVAGYMLREYAVGRTPNPDVMCNKAIKFGLFLQRALEMGADAIATGHYTRKFEFRISNFEINSKFKIRNLKLLVAKDTNKDQSYFLWTLAQEQLKYCLFPIGDYTKPEVRELARKFGLPTADKPDSQGICFVGEVAVRDFLQEYLPVVPGPVLTAAGKRVGEHEGVAFYTIGQRRGVGSAGGGTPYYVIEKDAVRNALIVAEGADDPALYGQELVAGEVNWISGGPPRLPLACKARIRYRQPLQEARIMNYELGMTKSEQPMIPDSRFLIRFDRLQRAITPGQSVVFYRGREMLGGGVICAARSGVV
ncbi:tRNA 2-thiouridine(34) synthase MnmA [Candidatus Parcubacteria bacterium]|nr:tRNA 2-thiouridine(34) synthase MnmA [Candidatus Parcubacteria bacterium]MBI4099213.1 tRNA 2-thiouridine(34) synthase MnmA [Candidatus Parcubacteria bacterium]